MIEKPTIDDTSIVFLRHGETKENKDNKLVGQINPVLNEEGIGQATKHKLRFLNIRFSHVYTSDLCRAHETARIIADKNNIVADPLLREASAGDWDGREVDDLKKTEEFIMRNNNKYIVRPPGGESYNDVEIRLSKFFRQRRLCSQEKPILVVSHKGVLRCISRMFSGASHGEAGAETFDYEDWVVVKCRQSELIYIKYTADVAIMTKTTQIRNNNDTHQILSVCM